MAKRKRLTPAEPDRGHLTSIDPPSTLDAKSAFSPGVAPTRTRTPISQVAGDAATAAALEDLAQQMRQARASGRLIQAIPENQIDSGYLVRDRTFQDDEDMQALMQSLQTRGQQTPVELVELENGRFGLISGWRRLTALRRLYAETGEQRFATVLGVLRQPDTAADAYLAMIEENEIRVGLSHYERARIAAKAVEQGIYTDEKKALLALFATASRAKRSKIRSFLPIYHALDDVLCFAAAIPERLGLQISKLLETDAQFAARLKARLVAVAPDSVEAEQACLMDFVKERAAPASGRAGVHPSEQPALARAADVELAWSGAELVLRGRGVTPAFADRLQAWLNAADPAG